MMVAGPFDASTRIGFIGLGAMGHGMAHCLLRKGLHVQVMARRAEVARAFIEAGATAAADPADLGRNCALVLLSLPDAGAVEEVLFGAAGLASTLAAGSVVIDTSTIAASAARDFGQRLQQRGVWLLDAPVSGGKPGADAGTLACMVGGPAPVVDACRDVLGAFCKTITHVGELGAGQVVKACNQVAVACALLGVGEAIALALAEGVDPNVMREVLLGGAARSFSLEKHAPRVIDGSFKPGFRAQLMRKDLRIALDAARAAGAVLPATALAEQVLDATCEAGRADWDWSAAALEVQRRSGLAIPATPEPS